MASSLPSGRLKLLGSWGLRSRAHQKATGISLSVLLFRFVTVILVNLIVLNLRMNDPSIQQMVHV